MGKHTQQKRSFAMKNKHHGSYKKRRRTHVFQEKESNPLGFKSKNPVHKKVQGEVTEDSSEEVIGPINKIPRHMTIADSDSSDSDEETPVLHQLVSTFSGKKSQKDIESDVTDDEEQKTEKTTEIEAPQSSSAEELEEEYDNNGEDEKREEDSSNRIIENHSEDEAYSDSEEEREEPTHSKERDPYTQHFENEIPEDMAEQLQKLLGWEKSETEITGLGRCICTRHKECPPFISTKDTDLHKAYVKKVLCSNILLTNRECAKVELRGNKKVTYLQQTLFNIINNYQDLMFCDRDHKNGEELRFVYCLHALNHVLKTRSRVLAHNAKIKTSDTNTEYRDQGLTRPKVLIVLPFRESALRVVNMLTKLLMDEDKRLVSNKKRFLKEFGLENATKRGYKPEDHEENFYGNTDDHFRIGLSIAKKTLRLYTPFYASDIILSSPLGLRTLIGAEGEEGRDYDFLSSIEVLVFDQMEIILMQNWDHILHIMAHMHLQPRESHGVDFSRVRMWTLNGWSKYYRQTMMFSSVAVPEISAVFNRHCQNYAGKVQVMKLSTKGTISQIVVTLPQVFHRIPVDKYSDEPDARFQFFVDKILPEYRDPAMKQTLIYIPSYFDFVRLRNYLKKEEIRFQKLCEYTTSKSMTRARSFLYHGYTHFLLYTERLHFYRRFKLRGIKHVIFYDLPTFPHFYSEVANMVADVKTHSSSGQNFTCCVLYTKYNSHKLASVVGADRAAQMLCAEKSSHMLLTGNS